MGQEVVINSRPVARLTFIEDIDRLPPWCEIRAAMVYDLTMEYVPAIRPSMPGEDLCHAETMMAITEVCPERKEPPEHLPTRYDSLTVKEVESSIFNVEDDNDGDDTGLYGEMYLTLHLIAAPVNEYEDYDMFTIIARGEDSTTIMEILLRSAQPSTGMHNYETCRVDRTMTSYHLAVGYRSNHIHFRSIRQSECSPGFNSDCGFVGGSDIYIGPLKSDINIWQPNAYESITTAVIDTIEESEEDDIYLVTTDNFEVISVIDRTIFDLLQGDKSYFNIDMYALMNCELEDLDLEDINNLLHGHVVILVTEYAIDGIGHKIEIDKQLLPLDYAWSQAVDAAAESDDEEEYEDDVDENPDDEELD